MGDTPSICNYDVRRKAGLTELGFRTLGRWGEILTHGLPQEECLNHPGVYAVLKLDDSEPKFIQPGEVQRKHNVINPYQITNLRRRWVEDAEVLYFGAAGLRSPRSLRKRLQDMRRHSMGRTTSNGPHKGGEILWQIHDYEIFEIMVLPTGGPPQPRTWELALINQFTRLTRRLPFANRVVGAR